MELQAKLKAIGDSGCYFLCLRHLCNRDDRDVVADYDFCVQRNWITEDCYVNNPVAILNELGKLDFRTVEKSPNIGQITMYKRNNLTHFICTADGWDPLGESNTVKYGHIENYRRFE